MIKYFSASAVLKNTNALVGIKSVVLTATGATAVATLKTGGASGTTVGDIRVAASGDSTQVVFSTALRADYIVLSNGVALVEFFPR